MVDKNTSGIGDRKQLCGTAFARQLDTGVLCRRYLAVVEGVPAHRCPGAH